MECGSDSFRPSSAKAPAFARPAACADSYGRRAASPARTADPWFASATLRVVRSHFMADRFHRSWGGGHGAPRLQERALTELAVALNTAYATFNLPAELAREAGAHVHVVLGLSQRVFTL